MFEFILLAFVLGFIAGGFVTKRISAWWYGRQMAKVETRTKNKIAAKLVTL